MDIEIDFKEAQLPRQRPPRRRLDTCEVTADNQTLTDVQSINRVKHPAVDKIILNLKTRFAENDNEFLWSLVKFFTMEKPDEESLKFVSELVRVLFTTGT